MAIHVAKPRSVELDESTYSQPVAASFFISLKCVFLFPVGEFVLPSRCILAGAHSLSWLPCLSVGWIFEKLFLVPDQPVTEAPLRNSQVGSSSLFQERQRKGLGLMKILTPEKERSVREEIQRDELSTRLLHPLSEVMVCSPSTLDHFQSEPFPPSVACSFLLPPITLWWESDRWEWKCYEKEIISSAVVRGRKEIKLWPMWSSSCLFAWSF